MPSGRPGGPRRRRLKPKIFSALVGLVLTVGVWRLTPPLTTIRDQCDRLSLLETQKAALLAERNALEAERTELATQLGQEAAARRQGYARPGERRLVFVRPRKAAAESAAGSSALAPEDRVASAITSAAR